MMGEKLTAWLGRARSVSPAVWVAALALAFGAYNTYLIKSIAPAGTAPLAPSQAAKKLTEKEAQNLIKSGAAVLGNPNAKVTVVEFADFQCPFCGKYFTDVFPEVKARFIDTGLVKFVHADFAFLGEESLWAAMAARCAKDQGKYWEYHDALYENQQGENRGAFSLENLKGFAASLGLDQASFNQCLDSRKYQPAVETETAMGRQFGVQGTPATFVDGFFIRGLQGVSYFINRIETALK